MVSKMEFWQQYLAIVGGMVVGLAPFAVIRWVMYKRDMRELKRERQQWLKQRDDWQREMRPRPEAVDETRRENPADRPIAGE